MRLLSPRVRALVRQVDCVTVKGSRQPMGLYTYDVACEGLDVWSALAAAGSRSAKVGAGAWEGLWGWGGWVWMHVRGWAGDFPGFCTCWWRHAVLLEVGAQPVSPVLCRFFSHPCCPTPHLVPCPIPVGPSHPCSHPTHAHGPHARSGCSLHPPPKPHPPTHPNIIPHPLCTHTRP